MGGFTQHAIVSHFVHNTQSIYKLPFYPEPSALESGLAARAALANNLLLELPTPAHANTAHIKLLFGLNSFFPLWFYLDPFYLVSFSVPSVLAFYYENRNFSFRYN